MWPSAAALTADGHITFSAASPLYCTVQVTSTLSLVLPLRQDDDLSPKHVAGSMLYV